MIIMIVYIKIIIFYDILDKLNVSYYFNKNPLSNYGDCTICTLFYNNFKKLKKL